MPVSYSFGENYVHFRLVGKYTFADALKAIDDAVADNGFATGMNLILDVSDSEEMRTSYEIEQLAAHIGAKRIQLGKRVALCVRRAPHYGLARMLKSFGQRHGLDYSVFLGCDEARAWVTA